MIPSCFSNRPFILASASPRRQELLRRFGFSFTVCPSHLEEASYFSKEQSLDDSLRHISLEKAKAARVAPDDALIIGADTVVVCDENVLAKPGNRAVAEAMLTRLSGRSHAVKTGLSVLASATGDVRSVVVTTMVWFKSLTPAEIDWYLAAGEYADKAGAYGIQGKAGIFIEKIEGCYYNVVGLPINAMYEILLQF